MRSFNTGDGPTDANLSRLDHFASWTDFDGGYRAVDGWLVAVIETIGMLPLAVRRIVLDSPYMVAGAHCDWPEPRRQERWRAMAATLKDDLDKLDARLKEAPPLDMADRPITRGERVYDLATKLMDEGLGSAAGAKMLQDIARNSTPNISSDVRELQRLANLRRKPDDYRSKMIHHLYHMRLCTWEMHFLKFS